MLDLNQVQRQFKQHFPDNGSPLFFSAPGRTELAGNHCDHQGGHVIAAAIDLSIAAAVAPNSLRQIRLYSSNFSPCILPLTEFSPIKAEAGTPVSLIRGILAQFETMGCTLYGLDLCVCSQVPVGGGLSSSAAFEILFAAICNHFFCQDALSPIQLAQIGQKAENLYFGKPCGLMDQLSSSLGGILHMDFSNQQEPVIHSLPLPETFPYALCVIDTGSQHQLLTPQFSAIPHEMGEVCEYFGCSRLCQVPENIFWQNLPALRRQAGDRAILRCVHFYQENHRVQQQVQALLQRDYTTFLQLVKESGKSSWMLLQNVIPEGAVQFQPLALALTLCQELLHGKGAYRIHGGGFAGMVQAYVPWTLLPAFTSGMEAVFGPGCVYPLKIRKEGGQEERR